MNLNFKIYYISIFYWILWVRSRVGVYSLHTNAYQQVESTAQLVREPAN